MYPKYGQYICAHIESLHCVPLATQVITWFPFTVLPRLVIRQETYRSACIRTGRGYEVSLETFLYFDEFNLVFRFARLAIHS